MRSHDDYLRDGFGAAWLPDAIDRKIPFGAESLGMAVDLSGELALEDENGPEHRYHLHERVVQRAVKNARAKPVSRNA